MAFKSKAEAIEEYKRLGGKEVFPEDLKDVKLEAIEKLIVAQKEANELLSQLGGSGAGPLKDSASDAPQDNAAAQPLNTPASPPEPNPETQEPKKEVTVETQAASLLVKFTLNMANRYTTAKLPGKAYNVGVPVYLNPDNPAEAIEIAVLRDSSRFKEN